GERMHRLRVPGVPLHGHLDLVAGALALEVEDRPVDRRLGLVDGRHVVLEAIRVVEGALALPGPGRTGAGFGVGTGIGGRGRVRVRTLAEGLRGVDRAREIRALIRPGAGSGVRALAVRDGVQFGRVTGLRATVRQRDGQALVEERHLLEATGHNVEDIVRGREDTRISEV